MGMGCKEARGRVAAGGRLGPLLDFEVCSRGGSQATVLLPVNQHVHSCLLLGRWTIVTLMTVGYGDVFPLTPGGKFVAGICMVAGAYWSRARPHVCLAFPVIVAFGSTRSAARHLHALGFRALVHPRLPPNLGFSPTGIP